MQFTQSIEFNDDTTRKHIRCIVDLQQGVKYILQLSLLSFFFFFPSTHDVTSLIDEFR